jgi:RimJ/RimL family protein N-acetyltransferase
MTPALDLEAAWPPFALRLCVGDLELRAVTDDDALALGRIIHRLLTPEEAHFTTNLSLHAVGRDEAETVRNTLRFHWKQRSGLAADSWSLPLTVVHRGVVVGSQGMGATHFSTLREIDTGSYLAPEVRGRGIGTRMRAIVVEFAFRLLRAESATSAYMPGNEASAGVSRRLGYEPDGVLAVEFRGRRLNAQRLRLDAARWAAVRPCELDDLRISGADALLPLLGATGNGAEGDAVSAARPDGSAPA